MALNCTSCSSVGPQKSRLPLEKLSMPPTALCRLSTACSQKTIRYKYEKILLHFLLIHVEYMFLFWALESSWMAGRFGCT